jgi:aminoglycoside phosphotransferase (APT) family kinase protein
MRERADTVALWEEVSGKSAADLDWYIDFAAFKMLCLGAKMSYDRDPSAPAPDWAATPMAKYFTERFGW